MTTGKSLFQRPPEGEGCGEPGIVPEPRRGLRNDGNGGFGCEEQVAVCMQSLDVGVNVLVDAIPPPEKGYEGARVDVDRSQVPVFGAP